ncbi:MAG: hypothetical protein ACK4UO_16855 [Pseudolabrys sp.]
MSPVSAEPDEAEQGASYSFRSSLLGPGWEFRITGDGLDWSSGQRAGHVPFAKVRRVRMAFRPLSMQSYRFLTEVWAEGTPKLTIASTSWKGLVEHQRLDKEYSAFVRALHRGLARSRTAARLERGSPPLLYWPGVVVLFGMALGFAVLIVFALRSGSLAGAAFVAAFLLLFLWQSGNFFRRNRPGLYPAEAPPEDLLPGR